jgi:putative transposase
MTWSETNAMKERARFVLEWELRWDKGDGELNMSELCREFGISRECGYKWVNRFRASNFDIGAIEERSRRPLTSPTAVDDVVEALIVEGRKARPKWGPLKLRAWLSEQCPNVAFPSASAFSCILKRRGLVPTAIRRRVRGPVAHVEQPFAGCDAPNSVWCVDFKGWFETHDGKKCYPLTITDAFSRQLLRCEALEHPDGKWVASIFDSAFQEFGLPAVIRSDNGVPFASTGAAGLTRLSAWWLRLGIRLERIAPGKPQQNGRHERMHRTLKLEVDVQANRRAQQRAFDEWRRDFNEVRPHAALGHRTPASIYSVSRRRYPCQLLSPAPHDWGHALLVDKLGFVKLLRRKVFVSTAVRHMYIDAQQEGPDRWSLHWARSSSGT